MPIPSKAAVMSGALYQEGQPMNLWESLQCPRGANASAFYTHGGQRRGKTIVAPVKPGSHLPIFKKCPGHLTMHGKKGAPLPKPPLCLVSSCTPHATTANVLASSRGPGGSGKREGRGWAAPASCGLVVRNYSLVLPRKKVKARTKKKQILTK